MLVSCQIQSPIGPLFAAAETEAIRFLEYEKREGIPRGTNRVLKSLEQELSEYFAGGRTHFETPIEPAGTPFQKQVWAALLQIPYGKTCSYAELARAIGRPTAFRAVANANGANPISILIPCHRVINTGGALGGYGGGLPRKKHLLELETR